MDAILIKVDAPKASKHGGMYTRMYFRSVTHDTTYNKIYRIDAYDKYPFSKRFSDTVQLQRKYEGLKIHDAQNRIISADSNFKII